VVRLVGGIFFLTGMLLMAYNVWRTVRVPDFKKAELSAQIA
jgi:cytochrome c oxidase cbb3-type subunit 1